MTADLIERQEAIDALTNLQLNEYMPEETQVTLESAKAIMRLLPSAQPKRTEERTETHGCDCISRQAAIDLCDWYDNPSMREDLENLPSAQPERKKGKWIKRKGMAIGHNCSVCGRTSIISVSQNEEYNYIFCPYCGSSMEGEQK